MAPRRSTRSIVALFVLAAIGVVAARVVLGSADPPAVALTGPIAATGEISREESAFASTAAAAPTRQTRSRWSLADPTTAMIPNGDSVVAAGGMQRSIALTFDDGPSDYTRPVLDALARYNVHATFFVIGKNARAYPATLHAVADAGHELANHTWSHTVLLQLPPGARRDEMLTTSDAIDGQGLGPATLVRPPYGTTDAATNQLARSLGLVPVVWSIDTRDWTGLTAEKIAANVLAGVKPGSIVLLHDGGGDRSATVAALDLIIPALKKRHYRFATVSALLNASPPSSDQLAIGR